ncbi:MAG: sigma-70 family RNA polymerase sigma factor [Lentisphaeria bacterium]|nr:sigma-70 family RNA polymerase sigma factor [Lentisphaeria bacterium]
MANKITEPTGYTTRESHLYLLGRKEEAAWREFYEKYRSMIFGIGKSRKLSKEECEDLLQEVALICSNKLQDFIYDPARCRFRTFLYKIAENVSFNISRRKNKIRCLPLKNDYAVVPELDIKFMQEYEQFLLDRSFLILKNSISSESYLAFDMVFRQKIPVEEVVACTGFSAGALYTLKHRCLKKLRRIISELGRDLGTPQETVADTE